MTGPDGREIYRVVWPRGIRTVQSTDVAQGKISAQRARALYGVLVDPATQALDAAVTTAAQAGLHTRVS
jgi:hypothetical protein